MDQFQDILRRSGIPWRRVNQQPRDPSEEGVMLEVPDLAQIPTSAQKIREAFEIASIPYKMTELPAQFLNPNPDVVIFVGPRPIRWR